MSKINIIVSTALLVMLAISSNGFCDETQSSLKVELLKSYEIGQSKDFEIEDYKFELLGKVENKQGVFYLVFYPYSWRLNDYNVRGNSKLLVFNNEKKYIGRYLLNDQTASVTFDGNTVSIYYPDCENTVRLDFTIDLPKEDSDNYGISYTKDLH